MRPVPGGSAPIAASSGQDWLWWLVAIGLVIWWLAQKSGPGSGTGSGTTTPPETKRRPPSPPSPPPKPRSPSSPTAGTPSQRLTRPRGSSGLTAAIDFGTTFTAAAVSWDGRPSKAVKIDGSRRMPSAVFREEDSEERDDNDGLVVGKRASRQLEADPSRAMRTPKLALAGPTTRTMMGPGEPIEVVRIAAAVLAKAWEAILVETEGARPDRVILTHPATWADSKQQRLIEAARLARISGRIELLPEPVAAAVHFARGRLPTHPLAVYDLGGGTLDVAIVKPEDGRLRVAGQPAGLANVGGELFDERLYDWIEERLDPEIAARLRGKDLESRRFRATVRRRVTEAKELLSESESTHVMLTSHSDIEVTREEFVELILDDVRRTAETLERTAQRCQVRLDELGSLHLAGGASKMPIVKDELAHLTSLQPESASEPKLAVCLGAAIASERVFAE